VVQEQKPRERPFISELIPDWNLTKGQKLWVVRIVIVIVVLLGLLTLIGLPFGITLWDWAELLIVPLVLAGGGFWFSQWQHDRDHKIAKQQQDRDRKIAKQRAQDEALQAYLDHMSQLLTDRDRPLRRAQLGDGLSTVAQARTLTTLRQLGAEEKSSLLQFLYQSRLIWRQRPVVSLVEADLSKATLSWVILSEANLVWVDLSEATLSWADLEGADLSDAILRKADLTMAFLSGVDMTRANLLMANLSGANKLNKLNKLNNRDEDSVCLRQAVLIGANLSGANLVRADLRDAKLRGANLSGADLSGAKLSGADLAAQDDKKIEVLTFRHEPDLQQKLLREANTRGADLSGANLRGATGMSNKEFERQAASLKGATMPEGKTYEDWVKQGRPPRSQHKRSQSD
jgi:uncharacterized protein YjbI with pentapeptide repeats